MSKLSVVKFRMPAMWVAAIAVLTVAIAGGVVTFLTSRAQGVHATNLGANKSQAPAMTAEHRGRVRASLDALPLAFEANQGQTDPQVKYTARGNGYSVFLTASDAVFAITSAKHLTVQPSRTAGAHSRPRTAEKVESAAIDMRLVGGNLKPEIVAGSELPGVTNYYVGSDPKSWHRGVKQYSAVSYRDVYPGVDMVFHGAQRQLEFDFVVSPGADPKTIGLGFKGAKKLATDAAGNLVLVSSAGDVVLHKPVAYQEKDGKREIVEAAFQVKSGNEVALNLGAYDRGQELVIDPSLSYSTYLGGTAEDDAYAIAIDSSGNAYVTGQTQSTDFPHVTGAFSTTNAGGFDVFVSKIAADGSSLLYSTYIGGSGNDSGNAIAVDGSGNAFVAGGTTSSTNFPTTGGAFQTTFKGGSVDAFVLELASNGGSLVFSTYLGGSGDDVANGIAVDATGVYAVGFTRSNDFPLSGSPLQGSFSGSSAAFVTKLNTSGTSPLIYSTYLGGGTNDFAAGVAVASGKAYITGATTDSSFPVTTTAFQSSCGTAPNCNGSLQDAFVTVLNSSGGGPDYSTYLGGQANDQGLGIAVDTSGNAYVTGLTQSSLFPVKSAAQSAFGGGTQDAFVAAFNPSGTPAANTLLYSTFLGGLLDDAGNGIAVDGSKNAYVVGQTSSSNFPTAAPTQATPGGGADGFVSEISASGSLVFSTYLGGALNDNTNASNPLNPVGAVAVDSAGANIYVTGNTLSSPFPTVSALQTTYGGLTDAFVAKYSTGTSSANFTVSNGALSNTSGHAGVSATSTITVGSTNGFNSAVQLQCSVAPVVTKGPTCSFSSASVTPPANGTTTSTLTVATTAASAMLTHPANGRSSGVLYALMLPVFGLTFLGAGIGSSGPRRRKFLGLVITGMVLMCLLLLPACGGSNNNNGGGGGTPAGTYTITVTGSNGGIMVTGTPALTLTIN